MPTRRESVMALLVAGAIVLTSALAAVAADPEPQIKCVTVPERTIPQPLERGKPYPVPATEWKRDPVLWGWTCELPDGTGLAFGGVDQLSDDGRPHTRVLVDGKWTPIIDELRKANPLQPRFAQVRRLRDACKDALAKARSLYFEGKSADAEAAAIKADIDPAVQTLAKELAALIADLKGAKAPGDYEAGQIAFALGHLEASADQIKPFDQRTTPERMATMRRAQIELEIAAEAFDAEPPPRALSRIAWEPKTKQFVIFGGEHFDYQTNDLWLFDPAGRRWQQRHQQAAPEPRCDALIEALGDGRIAIRGGCQYVPGKHFIHVGPARWVYDIAKNAWTPDGHEEKGCPSDTRSARYWPPAGPEGYMKGDRPDAAAHEAKLKALPANTWARLDTPIELGSRDWGTWVYDAGRDMLYIWAGGHASYCGNDVARFHLATGRWEITDPVELPLGCCGTNEQYPSGFDFNLRPWVKKHVWNGQAFDPALDRMVMASVNDQKIDPHFYLYDPAKADWAGRGRMADGQNNDAYGTQLRYTAHGMFDWFGDKAWLLDEKTLQWQPLAVKGRMPGVGVDSCGMVYDPKRDRMLLVTLGGYAKPYDGQIHALDLKTMQITPLDPQGLDNKDAKWQMFLREAVYVPTADLFLWITRLTVNGKTSPDQFCAYDPKANRWVGVQLALPAGKTPVDTHGVCLGAAYDAGRDLVWVGDAAYGGGVWALRLDADKARVTPLKDVKLP
ncbi:MAG: hypothetical protein BIFFINMI_04359 [Phycisphaerae bacterium]|nr:hypothetical protein [Phycisphaerae bacterium]